MTTTTTEYWSIIPADGVEYPLQTLAKNITTWGDDRQGVPPLRGEDVTIPWIPGDQEIDRMPASRVIGLGMWVIDTDDNGAVATTRQDAFNKNWRILQRIFWNEGKVFTLRKRWRDETNTLQTADARARYDGGLTPSMMSRTGAKFAVDLRLADPFFYSTTPVNLTIDSTVSGGLITPTIQGTVSSRKVSFVATSKTGGVTTPTLMCTQNGHTWALDVTTTAGAVSLTANMKTQNAQMAAADVSGFVTHSGSDDWFKLPYGTINLTASAAVGGWSGTLTYYPTWI